MCQGWSCDGEIFLQTLFLGTRGGNPAFSSARRLQGEATAEEPRKEKRTKRLYEQGDLAGSSQLKDSTGVLTDSPPDKQGLITAAMIPFC